MTGFVNIDKHVGTRAKQRRVELGFSLQQLGDKIRVTEAQMFRYRAVPRRSSPH